MARLNAITKMRLTSQTKEDLKNLAGELGFRETDLARHLLNRALRELKSDVIKAGGVENLEFTIRNRPQKATKVI